MCLKIDCAVCGEAVETVTCSYSHGSIVDDCHASSLYLGAGEGGSLGDTCKRRKGIPSSLLPNKNDPPQA